MGVNVQGVADNRFLKTSKVYSEVHGIVITSTNVHPYFSIVSNTDVESKHVECMVVVLDAEGIIISQAQHRKKSSH
jgi:CO dehydrogenase/acetyl-CoA synthase gamma subunit (corrinoid Fe-S protein)